SIPLVFNGAQPNIYDADKAVSKPCEIGTFIGDTRLGGSCNFEEYRLIAHCNGTHSECIGHITDERVSIQKILKDAFIPSTLITVTPLKANDSADSYNPVKNADDILITESSLRDELKSADSDFLKGLIIRTLPNDDSKRSRQYMNKLPPFLSIEAMKYIVSLGVQHLLLDIPSVDRTFDEGKLTSHHIFWNVKESSHYITMESRIQNTITEMVYIPDEIKDGNYLLNIQIAPFMSDASPSRPLLFSPVK
ncbi:MAG: cyclase family protein, partial [Ignavibacteria bacterium]|nr:cyclase family protein [Ignavibacteria bacterium]